MKYFVPISTKIYEFLVYVSRIYSNKKKGWQHEKEVMSMCTKHPRKRPQFHQRKVMRFYNLTLQQGPEHFWSCISIWIVFQFTNLKNIFSNFILHYNKTRKRENLLENHIKYHFKKLLTPLCHTGISFPPIFFLFSCGLDSFHSLLQLSIGLRRSFFSLALQTIWTQNTYSRPLL